MLTGSFAMPAAENPTVAMVEAAYRRHGIRARYINCEAPPALLGHAVRGARAMGWIGFNCSIPRKGFVKPNAGGGLAVVGLGHEQPVPIFQQLGRGRRSGFDDVREIAAVAAQCRGSPGGARDRDQP